MYRLLCAEVDTTDHAMKKNKHGENYALICSVNQYVVHLQYYYYYNKYVCTCPLQLTKLDDTMVLFLELLPEEEHTTVFDILKKT